MTGCETWGTVGMVNIQYSLEPADPELVRPQELQLAAPPPEPVAGPPVDELYMSKMSFKCHHIAIER